MLPKPEKRVEDYHDVRKTIALIERIKSKYNIDSGRIYVQGMSMGNAMASQFARHLGHIIAGAAGCPTNTALLFDGNHDIVNQGGALNIWQSRLELDKVPPHYREGDKDTVLGNIEYWNRVNGCDILPKIRIEGNNNLAFFEGQKGVTVFMDVKNRDHGQTFDDAELIWDYLFSGTRREADGSITHTDTILPRKGDEFAFAVAEGFDRAWSGNRTAMLWESP
jgi:poly(3-hydroxybutyrate) depolymerase